MIDTDDDGRRSAIPATYLPTYLVLGCDFVSSETNTQIHERTVANILFRIGVFCVGACSLVFFLHTQKANPRMCRYRPFFGWRTIPIVGFHKDSRKQTEGLRAKIELNHGGAICWVQRHGYRDLYQTLAVTPTRWGVRWLCRRVLFNSFIRLRKKLI